ncbi:MAG: hypothetical protein ACHQ3P_08390 [Candidatus Limnocylindrales bacterium]
MTDELPEGTVAAPAPVAAPDPEAAPVAAGDHGRPSTHQSGLDLVGSRPLVLRGPVVWLPLGIGDRVIVRPGDVVEGGAPLAERVRDPSLRSVSGPARRRGAAAKTAGAGAKPSGAGEATDGAGATAGDAGPTRHSGDWHAPAEGEAGELIADLGSGWRMASGTPSEVLEAPAAGTIRAVRPGMGIELVASGPAIPGVRVAGGLTHGRLELAAAMDASPNTTAIDVGRAGSILVLASRIDAESLTRARAMGVRGVVVAGLSEKDLRDLAASDSRQRASLHRPPPFAVLVLDGAVRRPISAAVMAVLAAAAGRDVAIVPDPPCLLLGPGVRVPSVDGRTVRVLHGPAAGREGRWVGPAGSRRFRSGIHLEAGYVQFASESPVVVPLANLERYS